MPYKDYILYDSTYITFLQKAEIKAVVARGSGREQGFTANGLRELFRVLKMLPNPVNPLQKSMTCTLTIDRFYVCKFYFYKALCTITIRDSLFSG